MKRIFIETEFNSKWYIFRFVFNQLENEILQEVYLHNCENPNERELEIIQEGLKSGGKPLYIFSRKWVNEIENGDYSEKKHYQLIESLRKFPGSYLTAKLGFPHYKIYEESNSSN